MLLWAGGPRATSDSHLRQPVGAAGRPAGGAHGPDLERAVRRGGRRRRHRRARGTTAAGASPWTHRRSGGRAVDDRRRPAAAGRGPRRGVPGRREPGRRCTAPGWSPSRHRGRRPAVAGDAHRRAADRGLDVLAGYGSSEPGSAGTSTACSRSAASGTIVSTFSLVEASTTGSGHALVVGACPVHRGHAPAVAGYQPGEAVLRETVSTGRCRCRRCCSRNSAVTTAQIVWLPTS